MANLHGARVCIRQNGDGWYEATSPDVLGLFLVHPVLSQVMDDIGPTIAAIRAADDEHDAALMTGEQVAASLRERFQHLGEMTQWAKEIGVNVGQVSAAARTGGIQRKVADALGLERVVMYRRKS